MCKLFDTDSLPDFSLAHQVSNRFHRWLDVSAQRHGRRGDSAVVQSNAVRDDDRVGSFLALEASSSLGLVVPVERDREVSRLSRKAVQKQVHITSSAHTQGYASSQSSCYSITEAL
jgi:hypothetical protein